MIEQFGKNFKKELSKWGWFFFISGIMKIIV